MTTLNRRGWLKFVDEVKAFDDIPILANFPEMTAARETLLKTKEAPMMVHDATIKETSLDPRDTAAFLSTGSKIIDAPIPNPPVNEIKPQNAEETITDKAIAE